MAFLGLDGMQWLIVADVVVLVTSSTIAATLYRRLRRRHFAQLVMGRARVMEIEARARQGK